MLGRADAGETDPGIVDIESEQMIHQQQAMIAFAPNDAIGTDKTPSDLSVVRIWNQKGAVISAIPIQGGPSMEKVIKTLPTIQVACLLDKLAILFAGDNGRTSGSVPIIKIEIALIHFLKKIMMYIQMYWFLVVKEYIL
jgi:hypothetical protein